MINDTRRVDAGDMVARFFSKLIGYTTVVSIIALIFFFLILPIFNVVGQAFYGPQGLTLDYFGLLFANPLQLEAITNSLLIGLAVTLLSTAISLPFAIINGKYLYRGKALLSGLILVPMIMPPFVGAIGVQRLFARHGAINSFLTQIGLINTPIDWLSDSTSFWVVVVLEALHLYPIMYLNLSAALANIDPSMEEMAVTLGVSRWRQIKDIAWPLARPGYFAGASVVFIWALTDLGTPLLVGYHQTIPVKIFNLVTDINENPVGFALVFLVIVLTTGLFLLSKRYAGGKKYQMMARGHVTSSIRPTTGLGSLLIVIPTLILVSVALLPHLGVILSSFSKEWFMSSLPETYTVAHYRVVFSESLSLIGIKNSIFLATVSTILDLVLGVAVAYVVTRKSVPFSSLLDGIVMIPLALPGIVLAFGYVVTYSGTFLDPLPNPVPLLIIAYAVRRLPFMVRSAYAGLQQTSVSLEEASMSLGATRFHTLRRITLPLVTANLIAGGLLCFAYAMLDVSDSLILAMKDQFYPITKAIYVLFLEQGSGDLVASALGVIAMIILTACILIGSKVLGKKMGELFRA